MSQTQIQVVQPVVDQEKKKPTNMLLSKTYRGFTGNLNSRLFAKTEAETAAGQDNSGIPRGKSPWEKKEPEG